MYRPPKKNHKQINKNRQAKKDQPDLGPRSVMLFVVPFFVSAEGTHSILSAYGLFELQFDSGQANLVGGLNPSEKY